MPSDWSSVAKSEWNSRRSTSRPSESEVSKLRFTLSLMAMTAIIDFSAILAAAPRASSISFLAGTTRLTRPARSASSASMKRPVRFMSIDLALPTARVRRWVPPRPAMTPRFTSGWPNLAVSLAMMKSHCIASSQPPPSA